MPCLVASTALASSLSRSWRKPHNTQKPLSCVLGHAATRPRGRRATLASGATQPGIWAGPFMYYALYYNIYGIYRVHRMHWMHRWGLSCRSIGSSAAALVDTRMILRPPIRVWEP